MFASVLGSRDLTQTNPLSLLAELKAEELISIVQTDEISVDFVPLLYKAVAATVLFHLLIFYNNESHAFKQWLLEENVTSENKSLQNEECLQSTPFNIR